MSVLDDIQRCATAIHASREAPGTWIVSPFRFAQIVLAGRAGTYRERLEMLERFRLYLRMERAGRRVDWLKLADEITKEHPNTNPTPRGITP